MTKPKLTAEKQAEKFWAEVDLLAQEKIYGLLTRNLPLPGLKLITHYFNYTEAHQSLAGLFLHKDVDYRTLLGDLEDQYSDQELPEKEYLAEEIALYYFHLQLKGIIADLSDYPGYDSSYFTNLTAD